MTLTGFTMNSKEYAEDLNGGTINFFVKIACDYNCNVFTGLIERENNQFYNSLVHINEKGEIVTKYFKIHPYSPSGENKNYSAGSKPVITKINEWKIGLSICYDLRFPELYRHYGKDNVDLIVDISNWPVPRIDHWRTLLKARAIENQCYTAGVNRVGKDPKGNEYNGFSSVYDPMGKEIISSEKEEVLIAEIDFALGKKVRNDLPFLEDIKLI